MPEQTPQKDNVKEQSSQLSGQVKEHPKEDKKPFPNVKPHVPTLANVISERLGDVMIDRANIRIFELAVDAWIRNHYTQSEENKRICRVQLENAKLAIESIYNRVVQQL